MSAGAEVRRRLIVAVLCLAAACRADAPRALADSGAAVGAAIGAAADTTDGCRQTAGVRPDTSIVIGTERSDAWRRAYASGVEFRCAVNATIAVRIAIAGDTSIPSLDSIVVRPESGAHPAQVIRLGSDMELPMPYAIDALQAIDLDADGHRDLMLGRSWGATGNTSYSIWRFDPQLQRFAADTALSSMVNPRPMLGRPCVMTSSNSSVRDDGRGMFCLRGGEWRLDSLESNTWDRAAGTVINEVRVRRGDSLVLVRRETRPDSM
jgi:hypothetical protein